MLCAGWFACAVAVASGGCGSRDSGPTRYTLSGTVSFDGKPVPYGTISMAPDTSQGNSGPGSFAQVRDGRYRTASGAGTVGGPHVLTITGLKAIPGTAGVDPDSIMLFSSYQITVDLPRENTVHDIAVPRSAASP